MSLVLYFSPPPQLWEHEDQASQSDHRQSAYVGSQASTAHSALSAVLVDSHNRPPYLAATSITRVLCCSPPPQVAVHSAHPNQLPQWQSTGSSPGQSSTLHTRVSPKELSQTSPPFSGCLRISRVRSCWPPWHVFVQKDQSPQSPMTQFTAKVALHSADW
eukprot:CAMPEP_0203875648 /NCGR_PEP_ID=MMETSP0359-20131031/20918_1 /ASSEMBLY_ACC=CAM_ASM_000338 /TAXON_ID=268821 /ORGANISM="Scrippsiella Hangoei, Strain SHTV-5" /LENGTH=159 /DNA_ID=CAMNT_0050794457 /DNA_START=4125 /DNA_END=4601 /DNA_ORIENTATION=+